MNPDSKTRTPVQSLRSRLKEATADAILDAAAEVLVEQGLHAGRMESIAERAGVSVGTLYNHFEDRAALLSALRARRREAMLELVDVAMSESEGRPFAERIRIFVDALFAHIAKKDAFSRMLMQQPDGPDRAAARSEGLAQLQRRLDVLLAQGIQTGEVRPAGRDLYPSLLMGMIRGALDRGCTEDSIPSPRDWADEIVRVFLKGVGD